MSADQRTLAVYAAQADTYARLKVEDEQARALEAFLARLPRASHVLDLGCGPGLQARIVADAGHRVDAWDASPEFVAAARARGLAAKEALFDDLTADDTYDGIIASFSLLHAPRAAFPGHIARIARALKPGGVFYIGLKLGEGEHRDQLGRFYSYYSEAELRQILEEAGLRISDLTTGAGVGLDGAPHPFVLIIAHG